MAGLLDELPDAPSLDVKPRTILDELPDAPPPNPLEESYRTAFDAEPERAARVLRTIDRTGQTPEFVDQNLDAAAKVAEAPDRDFWTKLEREHPGTARFLIDPKNMAVVKDDLENLRGHEGAVREFGMAESMWRSLNAGFAQLDANLARLPAAVYDVAAIPQNLLVKAAGRPDLQVRSPEWLINNPVAKYYDSSAKAFAVPEMNDDIITSIGGGEYGKAGRALAAQFVANAPNQAAIIAATISGAGVPALVGMGALQAADANKRGRDAGVDPAASAINALAQGTIEAGFESLGTFGILKQWEGVIAKSYGKKVSREVMKDMARTLGASMAGEANEEFLTQGAQDISDYLTGVNPKALDGIGARMVNAGLVGGVSGGILTGGGAIASGTLKARMGEVRQAEQAKAFYTALGDKSKESKLRARLPEQHRKLVESLTQGGQAEAVHISAEAVERYFQSVKLDPAEVMASVGAGDSFMEAKATGGLVKIPTAEMTKLIEDGHYQALADDIKFDPEGFSVNEASARVEEVKAEAKKAGEAIKGEFAAAVTTDATLDEDFKKVALDVRSRLAAIARPQGISEKEWPQVIEDQAQIEASRVVVEARKRGLSVEAYYKGEARPDIKGEGGVDTLKPAGGTLLQRALIQVKAVVGEIVGKEVPPAEKEVARIEKFIKNVKNAIREKESVYPGLMEDFLQQGDGRKRLYGDELHDWAAGTHQALGDLIAELKSAHENPSKPPYDPLRRVRGILRQSGLMGPDDHFVPEGQPRGFYEPTKNMIALLRGANVSTYLHESAHVWLRDTFKFVASGKADERYLADWAVLKDFLGVKDGQAALTEIQQERFAAAFELYLYQGTAPSQNLKGVFARVRQWMTKIYADIKSRLDAAGLGEQLSPEVRGVFDRMLATEEEIAAAHQESGYTPVVIEGLDPQIAAHLESKQRRAREAAENILLKPQMSELEKANQQAKDERRKKATADAQENLSSQPLYKAMAELRERVGVSGKAPGAFGHDLTAKVLGERFLKGKVAPEVASYFEAVAEIYGFTDGADLARKASASKSLDEAVKDIVDREMTRFEQPDREAMREQARAAIYSDEGKMLELLALESEALSSMLHKAEVNQELSKRRRADASIQAAAAREYARETLAVKPVREATAYRPYITAERSAAVRRAKAIVAKNWAAAAKAGREQLFSHALAAEAMRLREQVAVDQRFLERFQNRGNDLLDMPFGFIHQIDNLLSRYGMGAPRSAERATFLEIAREMANKGETSADIANATGFRVDENGQLVPESLKDLLARINEDYITVSVPDSVLSTERLSSDVTPRDLSELRQAIGSIAETGKRFQRFLSAFLKGDIKEAAAELRASIELKIGTPYGDRLKIGSGTDSALKDKLAKLLNLPDTIIPDMVNLLTVVTYLDGGMDGPAHKYIYRPLKMAEDRKFARYEKMTADINALLSRHSHPEQMANLKNERAYYGAIGRYLTKEEVLVVALNWGNEGNRDRIRRGFRIDDQQVQSILDSIDHQGWKFVQDVWDHLQTYWPEIVKLETLVSGVQPVGVEASPVNTRYGAFRGGYYPIAYDFERSEDANRNAEQKNALYKQYSTAAAHTDKGHTQARYSQVNRPVRLSLDVLFTHMENVVHDLEYRAAVIDVSRFLKMMDAKASITNAIGIPGMKSINDGLMAVASDQGEHLSLADKALRWFRFKTTFATLALRAFTLPLDTTGNVFNGAWELGPTRMGAAMKAFALNPKDTVAFVNEKSQRMKQRGKFRDRDIMDMSRKWQGKDSTLMQYGFFIQVLSDEAISYPLWAETYRYEIARHGDETLAVNIADEAVTRTLGSGTELDRVGAQRGSETKKVFSMYYSWLSMMFNRSWLDGKMAGLEYRKGNTGAAVAIIAKTTLFAWVLQSINENFWREMFRNRQDDDEDARWKRIAARTLSQPFAYVWLARDIAGPVIDRATGQTWANYKFSPMESALDSIFVKTIGGGINIAMTDREVDMRYIEDAARAGSLMVGIPLQANNLAFNLLDWMDGNGELTWRDALTRRTKN